jgi:hypothetical protein
VHPESLWESLPRRSLAVIQFYRELPMKWVPSLDGAIRPGRRRSERASDE